MTTTFKYHILMVCNRTPWSPARSSTSTPTTPSEPPVPMEVTSKPTEATPSPTASTPGSNTSPALNAASGISRLMVSMASWPALTATTFIKSSSTALTQNPLVDRSSIPVLNLLRVLSSMICLATLLLLLGSIRQGSVVDLGYFIGLWIKHLRQLHVTLHSSGESLAFKNSTLV